VLRVTLAVIGPVPRLKEGELLTWTNPLCPSNCKAPLLSKLGVRFTEPIRVPVLLLPEASVALVPVPSSNFHSPRAVEPLKET